MGMKFILQFILKLLAKATLAKYQPRVIGVTGSVGKTGSRLAVVAVLQQRWRVAGSQKNLNNEIGLPLAIIGEADSGYRNFLAWLGIFSRALRQLIVPSANYPKVLVLEYGVDHPGDMDYLLSMARPEVAVVTAVSATHLEFLNSVAAVAQEKGKLVSALSARGVAVLNFDFPAVAVMATKTQARVVGYGEAPSTDIRLTGTNVSQAPDGQIQGMSFRLSLGGSTVPVLIRDAVGKPVASMAAAGAAVGFALGLSVLEITQGLKKFSPPQGRLRLIKGVGESLLIDDTYNSSPQALAEAIDILSKLPLASGGRRWAILGDMLELGSESERLHYEAGKKIVEGQADYLVTVGKISKQILAGARAAGMSADQSWHIATAAEVAAIVKPLLQRGDIVLVKGSQGVRCEKAVKALMAEPQKAKELLVRQSSPWV